MAIQPLQKAVAALISRGNFKDVADLEKRLGQVYETHDPIKACQSFVRAGDWYLQAEITP